MDYNLFKKMQSITENSKLVGKKLKEDTEDIDMPEDSSAPPSAEDTTRGEPETESDMKVEFGKVEDDWYYFVKNKDGRFIVDAAGNIKYKDEESKELSDYDFILNAARELDVTEVAFDIVQKFIIPKAEEGDEPEENINEPEKDEPKEDAPEEDEEESKEEDEEKEPKEKNESKLNEEKKVYYVEIQEILSKIVAVTADSPEQAVAITDERYTDNAIVLDYTNFADFKINVIDPYEPIGDEEEITAPRHDEHLRSESKEKNESKINEADEGKITWDNIKATLADYRKEHKKIAASEFMHDVADRAKVEYTSKTGEDILKIMSDNAEELLKIMSAEW